MAGFVSVLSFPLLFSTTSAPSIWHNSNKVKHTKNIHKPVSRTLNMGITLSTRIPMMKEDKKKTRNAIETNHCGISRTELLLHDRVESHLAYSETC